VTTHLRWCVGKFTFARGSDALLHFMPLKDIAIEDSLDLSHLFLIRSKREHNPATESGGSEDDTLARWMQSTAARLAADTVVALLRHAGAGKDALRVLEIEPGLCLIYEYLKSEMRAERIAYTAVGPAALQLKCNVLHADDQPGFRYVPDDDPVELAGQDLVIFNHNEAIQRPDSGPERLDSVMQAARGPMLLVLRVTLGPSAETRTTVRRHTAALPSFADVVNRCQAQGGGWMGRVHAGFDKDYFLPPEEHATALLLAFRCPGARCRGFRPLAEIVV
jgi:hypothetical protein